MSSKSSLYYVYIIYTIYTVGTRFQIVYIYYMRELQINFDSS